MNPVLAMFRHFVKYIFFRLPSVARIFCITLYRLAGVGVLAGREAVRLAVLGQASGEAESVVEGGKEVCEGKERTSGPLGAVSK